MEEIKSDDFTQDNYFANHADIEEVEIECDVKYEYLFEYYKVEFSKCYKIKNFLQCTTFYLSMVWGVDIHCLPPCSINFGTLNYRT